MIVIRKSPRYFVISIKFLFVTFEKVTVVYLCIKNACKVFLLYLDDVTNAIKKKWGLVI